MIISEVEKRTGLRATAIRYYESIGILQPPRLPNGYRNYTEETVETLCRIRQMRELGIPLADIRLWLDGVVPWEDLITKRLDSLDDDSAKTRNRKLACQALLRGENPDALLQRETQFYEERPRSPLPAGPLLMGIDLGTTSISVQIIAADSGQCIHTYSVDHRAAMEYPAMAGAYAEDAGRLLSPVLNLVDSAIKTYSGIAAIGITGQMHGIVCTDEKGALLSPLFTWQNTFGLCRPDGGPSICEEIAARTGEQIPTGYGIATLYALRRMGLLPEGTARIVTIPDLLAARLTGTEPRMHPTNAASLGGYDLQAGEFRRTVLDGLEILPAFLPSVVGDYALAGSYAAGEREIPVAVAIGGNQASIFGSAAEESLVLLNIGTSSQISMICDSFRPAFDLRPYFDGKWLLTGAALCGGRAYAVLKEFLRTVLTGFGCDQDDSRIFAYLNQAAMENLDGDLCVDTRFSGTRSDPALRGSITNLRTDNFTPGTLSAGILRGIVDELYQFYRDWDSTGRPPHLAASGNAIRRNPALRALCAKVFGRRPRIPLHTEEAAFGAALYGGISAGCITRQQARACIHYRNEG